MTSVSTRPDPKLPHRTRDNTTLISGYASRIDIATLDIRMALRSGNESDLQSALADLGFAFKAIEHHIVEQEQ